MRASITGAGAAEAFIVTFDGEPLEARRGESIAAALAAHGRHRLRAGKHGAPRGMHCGMGVCFECLVHVNGESNVRACLREVSPGDAVCSGAYRNLAPRPAAPNGAEERAIGSAPNPTPDVLVIGGGPAGLAAALGAAKAGAAVVLLDERPRLGGQYYKQPSEAPGFATGRFPDRQFRDGYRLIERVRASGVEIHTGALVWGAFAGPELSVLIGTGPALFRPRRLILATGAFERSIPMPGWTLPGFMTTGAVQTLLRTYRVCAGERVVISGHGPLNLQVAAELVRAGARVVALVETSRPTRLEAWPAALAAGWRSPDLLFDALRYVWTLKRAGVPILTGHSVVEARGEDKVACAKVMRLDETAEPIAHTERWLEADVVACSYGFYPSNEIARALGCAHRPDAKGMALVPVRSERFETTLAGVYVVGDCAGLGGARAAMEEGAIAGETAAREGARPSPRIEAAARRLAAHRRFQRSLWRVYRSPPLVTQLATDDTLVCRCEEVSLGEIKALAAAGSSIGSIKRRSRAGMGRCQGRYCSYVIQHLLASLGGPSMDELSGWAPRVPFKPVSTLGVSRAGE